MKLIIDIESGTILNFTNCFVVNYDDLSDDDKETLDYGFSDSEVSEVALRRGFPVQDLDKANITR